MIARAFKLPVAIVSLLCAWIAFAACALAACAAFYLARISVACSGVYDRMRE